MKNYCKHYINGEWVKSTGEDIMEVINPATEESTGRISLGTQEDLNKAVKAASEAFSDFSNSSREYRIELLKNIAAQYKKRKKDLIETITEELGAPLRVSEKVHYKMGYSHFVQAATELENFSFTERKDGSMIVKEPIGVSGLITPWNFPTNQTATKIASAIAAGSTMVLKPSEITPYAAMILAEIFEDAGLPKGVFNLVNGTGERIGNAISSHPGIDFVSFTGSGLAGRKVMTNAAKDIKKVALELGGKSPLIILEDADIKKAAKVAVSNISNNCGQVCTAATRIIVPKQMKQKLEEEIVNIVNKLSIGNPKQDNDIGPLVSKRQWDNVQYYISKGIDEGAKVLVGGEGKPKRMNHGYFVKPTVFTNVDNDMVVAREEIFGPVSTIITYDSLNEAIDIANDTIYGLAGYIVGENVEILQKVALNIQAGQIRINGAQSDYSMPFGGFKQSGIGREWGAFGIEEYLETKAIMGV